eukprot:6150467-Alexandrium_andersonii.AAC.1
MSASLVGSEMCIRDSSLFRIGFPALMSRPVAKVQQQMCNSAGNCRRSVSYTHLTLPTICSV